MPFSSSFSGLYFSSEYVNTNLHPAFANAARIFYPAWVLIRCLMLSEKSAEIDNTVRAGFVGSPETAHTDSVELQSDIVHAARTCILRRRDRDAGAQEQEHAPRGS
jgi:hypothetical protein